MSEPEPDWTSSNKSPNDPPKKNWAGAREARGSQNWGEIGEVEPGRVGCDVVQGAGGVEWGTGAGRGISELEGGREVLRGGRSEPEGEIGA